MAVLNKTFSSLVVNNRNILFFFRTKTIHFFWAWVKTVFKCKRKVFFCAEHIYVCWSRYRSRRHSSSFGIVIIIIIIMTFILNFPKRSSVSGVKTATVTPHTQRGYTNSDFRWSFRLLLTTYETLSKRYDIMISLRLLNRSNVWITIIVINVDIMLLLPWLLMSFA